MNWFSITAYKQTDNYVVVLYKGNNMGNGTWQCMKDQALKCSHISVTLDELKMLLKAQDKVFDARLNVEVSSE